MKTVLFMGDSLTEWNDWQVRFPSVRVVNLGLAGETVEGLRSRTPSVVSRYPQADMVFVMTGINNLAMGYADFHAAYRDTIVSLKKAYPQTAVHVQAVLPVAADWLALSDIIDVNRQLEAMSEEQKVCFLDTFAVFMDGRRVRRDYFDPDGVHVAPAGYRAWEEFLAPVIGD